MPPRRSTSTRARTTTGLLVALVLALGTPAAAESDGPPPGEQPAQGCPEPDDPGSQGSPGAPDGDEPCPEAEPPPPPPPPPPVPPPEDLGDSDAPAEEAPDDVVVDLPPPEEEPDEALVAPIRQAVTAQMLAARRLATDAELARLDTANDLLRIEFLLARAQQRLDELRSAEQRALARLESAQELMKERAASAYMRGPMAELDAVLQSQDVNDFVRRMEMVRTVLDADHRSVGEYRAARRSVSEHARHVLAEIRWMEALTADARVAAEEAHGEAERALARVASLEAGSLVAVTGFVFPVAEPYSFVDTFGAPRMPGTEYEHFHQGTDIFAPSGTPLLAVERGVVTRVGTDVLGGIKLWIVGASGNRYYYAHLTGYAEDIRDGLVVEPGQVVGFVGDTGNARGTPPHLHFEVHPPGAGAVNPYPLLRVVSDATRARATT